MGRPAKRRTDGPFAKQQRERVYGDKTAAELAQMWEHEEEPLSERTIRDIESGRGASVQKLAAYASKCRVEHWHQLLNEEEKAKLIPCPFSPEASAGDSFRLFQLPSELPDFTGREDELQRLAERLRAGVSSALRGMGGVGKTATAIKACREVKDDFPEGQLLVELRGMSERPMTAVQAMSRIIRDFRPETGKLPDDEKELQPLYRQVLAGKKALVLLDDARDESQVRSLLSVPPPVALVVTSRHALALDGVESIHLGVLPPDEVSILLRGIVGTKGTDEELQTVAELCGRLPLALRVAGDFLRLHGNWPFPKYIAALRDEAKRLERLKGRTMDRDVEAVLALSARELVRENPKLAEFWQQLSVFPANFGTLAASFVWELKSGDKPDTDTTEDELTALLDRSLVQYDTDSDRYSLHDLLRPIARGAFNYVEGHPLQAESASRIATAERIFAAFYLGVLSAATDLYLKGHDDFLRGLALFDCEEGNIRFGQSWAARNWREHPEVAKLCGDYSGRGCHIIFLRLSTQEFVQWLETALAAYRAIGNRHGEAWALNSLGSQKAYLGDPRAAITLYEQSLSITREIGDRQQEDSALGNLGAALVDCGDIEKGIACYEQSLEIAREIGDRRSEAVTLLNLGTAWSLLAYYINAENTSAEEIIKSYRETFKIYEELGDLKGMGDVLEKCAWASVAFGDIEKGLAIYESRVKAACAIGDSCGEATTAFSMAVALHEFGHLEKAILLAEHALAIYTEIDDPHAENVNQCLKQWQGEAAS